MALTQGKILWIVFFCNIVAVGVFTCALIFHWYHVDTKKVKVMKDAPTDLTIFDAMHQKGNGMYVLGCVAAMIGGICLGLLSMLMVLFGDACISKVGLDWLPGSSFIKGMLLRICHTAVMTCAFVGLFFGFQCREKGESMGLGWYMNMIICPFGVVAVVLIYYYPFAPSGEKGMFDSEEDDEDEEEGGGYGGADDDDDDDQDDDDDDGGKKKKKGGGWGDWGFSGGGGKDNDDEESGSGSESEPLTKKKGKK